MYWYSLLFRHKNFTRALLSQRLLYTTLFRLRLAVQVLARAILKAFFLPFMMASAAVPSGPITANASGLPRGQTLNGVAWSLTTLSLLFVAARIYSRTKLSDNAGLDDLFIGLAAVCNNREQRYVLRLH